MKKLSESIYKAFQSCIPKGSNFNNYTFFSNITDRNLVTRKSYSELNTGKLGIFKKDIRKLFNKSVSESKN